MRVIGLTGGIGSGKSTVAERLAELGAHVIDADRVAREVVEPGEPALAEIRDRFGDGVVTDDGRLDRPALAQRVFGDEQARTALEGITHPRIGERIAERLAAHAAAEQDGTDGGGPERIVVVDHPLLVETGQADDFETVVVVTAPEQLRVERLVAQRGMDRDDVRARMDQQATDEQRRAAADHVVDNSGDRGGLEAQVDALWARLRGEARP